MKEILLTSSALILALLVLRRAFRSQISRRAQYALWLLVLVRLLVPVNLPAAPFSLLTAAEPVVQQLEMDRSLYFSPVRETVTGPEDGDLLSNVPAPDAPVAVGQPSPDNTHVFTDGSDVVHQVEYERQLALGNLLRWVWYAGMALMGLWLLVSNLRFWRKLHKVRMPYSVEGCKYPIYLVEKGLPSPCLFGLFRPAVYLTPAAVATPERLRHVIAHESAHARHLDPLWALLRGVCLAVWWFDPLVWLAAAASKADGELACDEAALVALGPAERVPYGQTLLALIPVRTGPGDPLLSATTMTADKRRLKDRITRIAEGRQTRSAALFAVLALAAVVCAVTFTGAEGGGTQRVRENTLPEGTVALTGEELAYFNEEFFNQDTGSASIHNQFLTSLYERPEDINLYELFYCGTGLSETMSEMEWQLTGNFDANGELICPTDKLSVDAINTVLLENTGLTLAETSQIGMEAFQYLPEYDAYYHSHGDTNYFHSVSVAAGEQQGNTIHLYYPDSSARYQDCDWLCLTLEAREDGSYWFVSNLPSEKPAVPTVYPEGEPVLTLSLADLAPIEPEAVTVTHRQNDCAERGYGIRITTLGGKEYSFRPYRSSDGNVYAALINYEVAGSGNMFQWDVWTFFTYPAGADLDRLTIESFTLSGQAGVVVSYEDEVSPNHYSTIRDYYAVSDDGTLSFLLQACGTASRIDLDGDGTDELCAASGTTAQVFFQRDGRVYEADVAALLDKAWPEADYREFGGWDASRRSLSLWAGVPLDGADVPGAAFRWVYFDGADLLVYKDTSTYTDHVADGIDAPEAIVSAARDRVLEELNWWQTHTGSQTYVNGVWEDVGTPAQWDDWRITSLELTDQAPAYPELGVKVYSYRYEFHTSTPALVTTAGGMYMDEDGWVGGMNTDNLLVFHTMTSSGPTLLESSFPNDVGSSSDSPVFAACLARVLVENGLLPPSQVRDVDLYYMFSENQSAFLNLLGTFDDSQQTAALTALTAYAASVADTADGGLLDYGLRNLERNPDALTEAGRAAYQRLLAAAEDQSAVSADEVLASFRANPATFLGLLTHETEAAQTAALRVVASCYNSGTPAQHAQISDALHSLTQTRLHSADATAIYDRLRAMCIFPGPAERTAEDEAEILQAAEARVDRWRSLPGVTDLEVTALAIDQTETEQAVERYMASLYANTKGWSDDYVARLTVVRADFTAELDGAAMDADAASLNWDPGANAWLLALLPDRDTGAWKVLDSLSGPAVQA